MARKKKAKKITADLKAVGLQNIGYQGKVVVKLANSNNVLATKEYHNSGMPNLFKFLALSVAGRVGTNYNVDTLRPVKLKLFYYKAVETAYAQKPDNFSWDTAWKATVKPIEVSPFIHYDTTPKVSIKDNEESSTSTATADDKHYETTFHFSIPFSYISGDAIHMVGIYPNNATNPDTDVSAYYLFTKNDGKDWDPIVLDDASGNYSIIIEWTMVFTNKSVAQSI